MLQQKSITATDPREIYLQTVMSKGPEFFRHRVPTPHGFKKFGHGAPLLQLDQVDNGTYLLIPEDQQPEE